MAELSLVSVLLLVAIVGLMVGHAALLASQGRWSVFDPLNAFWAGVLVCYVGQPLMAGDIFAGWHGIETLELTLGAALAGFAAVVAGYESAYGAGLAALMPRLPARLDSARLLWAGWVMTAVGLLAWAYVVALSGGWEAWVSVGRGGTDYEAVQGYLPELAQGVTAGVFVWFARAQRYPVTRAGAAAVWLAAGALVWWFLYLGSRSRLITLALLLASSFYLGRGRSPRAWVVAALGLAILMMTNMQAHFRERFTHLSFNLDEVGQQEFWGAVLPPWLGGDRERQRAEVSSGAEFNCAMAVVKLVPEVVPYNYGYGFLELATRPVPRRLWPQKPYPHLESVQGVLHHGGLSNATVTTGSGELLMGPAFGFVGHWYYAGGFLAVAIGGFLTGLLFRAIRRLWERDPGNQSMAIVYPFLLAIGFNEAVSTPWYWFYTLPFVLGPLAFVVWWARKPDYP